MKTNSQVSGQSVATLEPKPAHNGHSLDAKPNFDAARQAAQLAIEAAEQALQKIAEDEQAEALAERARMNQVRDHHLMDARNFRLMARAEADETEKKILLKYAVDEEQKAFELGIQLGLDPAAIQPEGEPKPKPPFLKRPVVALLQVLGILSVIAYCYSMFTRFHDYIHSLNEKLPIERQLQPYDVTSIQKFFYEKLVVFSDLPVALIMLFMIVPFIGFYVLPILKSRKDFYTEFYEDLTPWQRSIITTAFCLGLLFFLALSHSTKP